MNRRGHLSTKIPQVKLRPAAAPAPETTASASRKRQRERERDVSPNEMDAEILRRALKDTEDEETSTAALRKSSRPWKGVIITFTGVENKATLSVLARELGAHVESALTIHVTHVVATGFGSAKYLYAVEHRLPVMTPTWIESAHGQWIKGEELDMVTEEKVHRLLPFTNLRIAMSGIEPLDRRKTLIKYINSNGGTYSKDLDRYCTHLISAKPTSDSRSSEKVKWALREIAEREAMKRRGARIEDEGMRIVYEEWIWDCVAFHGRWKEDSYDARKARRDGRVKAEDVINGTLERPEESRPVPLDTAMADAVDHNEPAMVRKRRRSGLESLVGELISTATNSTLKAEPTFPGELVNATNNDDPPTENDDTVKGDKRPLAPPPVAAVGESGRKSSMLHVSRSTSFAATAQATEGSSKLDPLSTTRPSNSDTRTSSLPPTAPPPATAELEKRILPEPPQGQSKGPKQFFDGIKFSHLIQEQCEGLQNALRAHGGVLVSEERRSNGEKVDFIIVRLSSDARPILRDEETSTIVVTECWVEGCCYVERLLPPDSHIVFRPLSAPMPVQGAEKLHVHLSGFSAENMVYMRRLLRALGIRLSIKLSIKSEMKTTHLVSVISTGQKVTKAREWGISVVKDSWLLEMARTGKLANDDDHRHPNPSPVASAAVVAIPRNGKNDLTANMSTVSDLGDNVDFTKRLPLGSAPAFGPDADNGRRLGSHPTHVDIDANGGLAPTSMANILSPPKPKTERLLNLASTVSIPEYMKNEKITRHASAPMSMPTTVNIPGESPGTNSPSKVGGAPYNESLGMAFKSASMNDLVLGQGQKQHNGSSKGESNVTEALKKLAEKEGNTPGSRGKIVRRSRPAARIKTRSPHTKTFSTSPGSRRSSATPTPVDLDLDIDIDTSFAQADGSGSGSTHKNGAGGPSSDGPDESIKIQYVDVNGQKERRKLLAMLTANGVDEEGRDSKRVRKR